MQHGNLSKLEDIAEYKIHMRINYSSIQSYHMKAEYYDTKIRNDSFEQDL